MANVGCGKSAAPADDATTNKVDTQQTKESVEPTKDDTVTNVGNVEKAYVANLKNVDISLDGVAAFEQILDSYSGKVVVLDFWATWCPPCRAAMLEVDKIKPALMDKGVCFVYITGETSPQKDFDAMMLDIHGDHYRLTDKQWSEICQAYNILGIPAYAVVGKDGGMAYSNLGQGGYPGNETIKEAAEVALTR